MLHKYKYLVHTMSRIYIGILLRRKKYLAVLLLATAITMVAINKAINDELPNTQEDSEHFYYDTISFGERDGVLNDIFVKGITAYGHHDLSKRVNNSGLIYEKLSATSQDSSIHQEIQVIANHPAYYGNAPAAKTLNIYIVHGPDNGSASAVAQASETGQNSRKWTLSSRNGGVNNSEETLQRNGTSNNNNNKIKNNNNNYDHKSDRNQISASSSMTSPYLNHSKVSNGHQGFRNAETVNRKCLELDSSNINASRVSLTVRWSKDNDVLYCPTYKIGTTFWRRVFMIQRERKYRSLVNPYLIPSNTEYLASKITLGNTTVPAFTFMFTRNIYSRLFSFYIDKLYAPGYYFWNAVGIKAVSLQRGNKVHNTTACRHVTFPEVIKYVIHTLTTGKNIDPHWVPIEQNCRPCHLKYDFIGRQESFSTDSEPVLKQLGLSKMADYLKHIGRDATEEDAITDALSQALTRERRFTKKDDNCMSTEKKIVRVWQKLQIKGLVGGENLDLAAVGKLTTLKQLSERARQSRMLYSKSQREEYKDEMYRKYWREVSDGDKLKLEELYATDFELFGYDSKLVLN